MRDGDSRAMEPGQAARGICYVSERNRGAVAAKSPNVHVSCARAHPKRLPALRQIGVDERANELVGLIPLEPNPVQLMENAARHLERAPDPTAGGIRVLDLDFLHAVFAIKDDGVKKLGAIDRE